MQKTTGNHFYVYLDEPNFEFDKQYFQSNDGKPNAFVVSPSHTLFDALFIYRIINWNPESSVSKDDVKLKIYSVEPEILKLNLELIDSKLPEILSFANSIRFSESQLNWIEVINHLKMVNPIDIDLVVGNYFYQHKIKSFLTNITLGMNAHTIWQGVKDSTLGLIRISKQGAPLIYYRYNQELLGSYLINNTSLNINTGNIYKIKESYFVNVIMRVSFL